MVVQDKHNQDYLNYLYSVMAFKFSKYLVTSLSTCSCVGFSENLRKIDIEERLTKMQQRLLEVMINRLHLGYKQSKR